MWNSGWSTHNSVCSHTYEEWHNLYKASYTHTHKMQHFALLDVYRQLASVLLKICPEGLLESGPPMFVWLGFLSFLLPFWLLFWIPETRYILHFLAILFGCKMFRWTLNFFFPLLGTIAAMKSLSRYAFLCAYDVFLKGDTWEKLLGHGKCTSYLSFNPIKDLLLCTLTNIRHTECRSFCCFSLPLYPHNIPCWYRNLVSDLSFSVFLLSSLSFSFLFYNECLLNSIKFS